MPSLPQKLCRLALFVGGAFLAATVFAQNTPNRFKTVELGFGLYRIDAEVADNDSTRQTGLMNRPQMGNQQGMVFVFEQRQRHCMWMRNTLIPLSVAFMDDDGKIINIEDMAPRTEQDHCALRPARFALEMNQGWFKTHAVKPGDTIRGVKALWTQ